MSFIEFYRDLAALYSPEEQQVYLIKGRTPDLSLIPDSSNELSSQQQAEMRFAPFKLGEYGEDPHSFCVVDKLAPHSVTDMMLMVFGSEVKSSFADLEPPLGNMILQAFYHFARFVSSPEVRKANRIDRHFLRIVLSVDSDTHDRYSVQSHKQFHPQLICYPPIESELVDIAVLDFIKTDDALLWEIQEPLALLGGHLLQDLVFRRGAPYEVEAIRDVFEPISFDPQKLVKMGYPLAYILKMKQSWDSLLDDQAYFAQKELHIAMQRAYTFLRKIFTGEEIITSQPWKRPTLLPAEEIRRRIGIDKHLFSDDSLRGLEMLTSSLRPVSDRAMKYLQRNSGELKVGWAERIIPAANLAYILTWFSPGIIKDMREGDSWRSSAYLALQPIFLRPIGGGGAGFDPQGKRFRVTRLGSKAVSLTEEERQTRHAFQHSFLRYLDEHMRLL